MKQQETFSSFFQDNKQIAQEYLSTKAAIYRLLIIRLLALTTGNLMWLLISLMLLSVFILFSGIVTGLWLSRLTGGYISGFGLTTLLLGVIIIILAGLRKKLFINPAIRNFIRKSTNEPGDSDFE